MKEDEDAEVSLMNTELRDDFEVFIFLFVLSTNAATCTIITFFVISLYIISAT